MIYQEYDPPYVLSPSIFILQVVKMALFYQRAAWIPYFHEITALIFLAPLSSFNERLAEDHRVNCLEDTFVLWRALSSNKILANVQLVGPSNYCSSIILFSR